MINEDKQDFNYLSAKLDIESEILSQVRSFSSIIKNRMALLSDDAGSSERCYPDDEAKELTSEQKSKLRQYLKNLIEDYVNTIKDLGDKLDTGKSEDDKPEEKAPEVTVVKAVREIPPSPFQPQLPFGY